MVCFGARARQRVASSRRARCAALSSSRRARGFARILESAGLESPQAASRAPGVLLLLPAMSLRPRGSGPLLHRLLPVRAPPLWRFSSFASSPAPPRPVLSPSFRVCGHKKRAASRGGSNEDRRRPTLPGGCPPSTIGAERLNGSVRNGKRCFPLAISPPKRVETAPVELENCTRPERSRKHPSSPRPISTGLLIALLRLHSRPIDLVVYQGSYSLKGMGELISRLASRLDAFSGYPCRA